MSARGCLPAREGCLPARGGVYPGACLPAEGCLPGGECLSARGGCLPARGVCPGGVCLPEVCLPRGVSACWGVFAQGGILTHARENITFPQLRLRTLIKSRKMSLLGELGFSL